MCDSCSEVSEDSCPPQVVDYPLNEAVEVPDTEGGLFKTVLVEGSGKSPVKGASVTVHYVGTLLDGTPFDSSRDRGEPFVFTLGKGQVIKGWDKGVATMRVGEKSILKCSPEYAYGEAGSPPKIPANSTLLFEVELFDWACEVDISALKDRSLMKEVFADGSGYEKPSFESTLRMDVAVYLGPYSEEAIPVWSKKDWSVEVGAVDLPPCLEECLFSMRPGESAAIRVAAHLCTDASPAFCIPEAAQRPDSAAGISYKVELHELKNIKSWARTSTLLPLSFSTRTRTHSGIDVFRFATDSPLFFLISVLSRFNTRSLCSFSLLIVVATPSLITDSLSSLEFLLSFCVVLLRCSHHDKPIVGEHEVPCLP